MKFEPTDQQTEKFLKPAFEEITDICDEVKFMTNCENDFLVEFLEKIADSYKNIDSKYKKERMIEGNL